MAKSRKSATSKDTGEDSSGIDARNVVQFFMEGLEGTGESGSEPVNHVPYVDMYSTPDTMIIEIEMPGVRTADIDVSIFKNTLNIKALKYECFDEQSVNYVCMERSFGKIMRSIEIPLPINTTKIKAAYINGILKIRMPRVEEKRGQPKKIPVESK